MGKTEFMDSALIAKHLGGVLADTYVLLLKTQNYHWNVTGPHFHSLHEMFEEQYSELFEAVDEIAERIRTLGRPAPGSMAEFAKAATVPEAKAGLDAEGMVADLMASHQTVLERVHACAHVADEQDDEGTEDLMTRRIAAHQKAVWMLGATAQRQPEETWKAARPPLPEEKRPKNEKTTGKATKASGKPDKKKAPKALG
jgi:starvation-inducible DNA-binding protein